MRVRKRPEGDCARRRQQKRTLFTRTIVGLLEPVRLGAAGRRGPPRKRSAVGPMARATVALRRGRAGSYMFPTVTKYDIYT